MRLSNLRTFSLQMLILFSLLDSSGDYLLVSETGIISTASQIFRLALTMSLLISVVAGLLDIKRLILLHPFAKFILIINIIVIIYSLFLGVISNNSLNAIRESISFMLLAIIPTLLSVNHKSREKIFIFFINSLVWVCFSKIIIAQLGQVLLYGVPSWKVFLKISPILVVPYAYYLIKFASEKFQARTLLLLSIVIFEILIAQARSLNISVVLVSIFILIRPNKLKTLAFSVGLILILGAGSMYITDMDFSSAFGIWSGDHFENSANYRIDQLHILIERFQSRPLSGFGFGFYTSGYSSYGELDIPYQLELDLVNFASKTGFIMFSMYAIGYILIWFYFNSLKKNNSQSCEFLLTSFISIFSLLFYSLFQNLHSSILFWIYYSLFFSMIFSAKSHIPSNIVLQRQRIFSN